MVTTTTPEQFTLFDVPATEPKKVQTKWEELQAMAAEGEQHGGFISPFIAAALLDVSRQRVLQLIQENVLPRHEYFGKPFVTVNDVAAFMNSERKTGRPPNTIKESFKRVRRLMKEKS